MACWWKGRLILTGLQYWRRLGLAVPRWRQLRKNVGGVGLIELVLDHWADGGDDGGVDVVDGSVLEDFLVEVRVQKDN